MKDYFLFVMVVTVITFLSVGLVLLMFAQPIAWPYVAIGALASGVLTGIVLKKI